MHAPHACPLRLQNLPINSQHVVARLQAPVWLHLSHCPPASIHVAPAAARAAVCTIPCTGRSFAAATLGTLPVVPVPLGCGESGQEAAERAAPLATADGSVAVWLLAAREPRERAVSAPEAVRIPEGSVLVLGDARRCGGELGFEDVHFTGAPRATACPTPACHPCIATWTGTCCTKKAKQRIPPPLVYNMHACRRHCRVSAMHQSP